MKKIVFSVFLLFMLIDGATGQIITGAEVRFKTKNSGKDANSQIEVIFKSSDNQELAYRRINPGPYAPFDPPQAFPLIPAPGIAGVTIKNFTGSRIMITYFPNTPVASANWRFDFDLYVTLSGGAQKVFSFSPNVLTPGNTFVEKIITD